MTSSQNDQIKTDRPLTSRDSGAYHPGPLDETDLPTSELAIVQAHSLDLALEEFSEGPYGATRNEQKLGKVSEWRPGQAFSARFRDSNPISTDRKVPLKQKPSGGPIGTNRGQA